MIRFVDLSQAYWTDPDNHGGPICAFLSTSSDRFIENDEAGHTFSSLEEIAVSFEGDDERVARLLSLVPDGFFGAERV